MYAYFCMVPSKKVWWQKIGTKTIQRATGRRRPHRPIATNDQSNIYHFKKQTVEKLTSQARITHDMHHVLLLY
jgi:hypothetical protein